MSSTRLDTFGHSLSHRQRARGATLNYAEWIIVFLLMLLLLAACAKSTAQVQIVTTQTASLVQQQPAPIAPSVASLMVQGAEDIEQAQFDDAVNVLKQATTHPNAPAGAYHLLGTAYIRAGQPANALVPARKAVNLSLPRSDQRASNLFLLGHAYYLTFNAEAKQWRERYGEMPGLSQLLQQMSRHVHTMPDGTILVEAADTTASDQYHDMNNEIEAEGERLVTLALNAESNLTMAEDIQPGLPHLHDTLGLVDVALWKTTDARHQFDDELKLGENAAVHLHIGELDLETDNIGEAVDEFDRAITLQPGLRAGYDYLSQAYDEMRDTDMVHWANGMSDICLSKLDDAQKQFDQVSKTSTQILRARAMLALARHDDGAARSFIDQATAMDPSSIPTAIMDGDMNVHQHKLDAALACYQRALSSDSTSDSAWFGTGLVKDAKSDFAGAVDAYSNAIKYNPGNSEALINRAVDCAELKRSADAISDLRLYLDRFPNAANTYAVETRLAELEQQPN